MKYMIGSTVLNGDHIVMVRYTPEFNGYDEDEGVDAHYPSRCEIDVRRYTPIVLRGVEADRFWKAYIGDAYAVFTAAVQE